MRQGALGTRRSGWRRRRKIIGAFLASHEVSADEFQYGLQRWIAGEESPEADASGIILAETFLMWRAWLKAQMKDPNPQQERTVNEK
jgi:hypothetical protein